MSARLPNVLRASCALLGTLVPIAPGLLSGCGTNSATPASGPSDAGVTYVSVVTQGGGGNRTIPPAGPGASGSAFGSGSGSTSGSSGASESGSGSGSNGDTEAGGEADASESGSASGSGTGSGSASGSGTGSGSASGSGSGSGNSSGSGADGGSSGASDAAPSVCDDYVVPKCGTTPCDLRSNTCCSTITLQTRCIPGANASCNSDEGTLHCWEACECTDGKVCCAVSNTIIGAVQTQCQTVANGSHCVPYPSSTTMASVQFCEVDSECKNGQPCVPQTCTYDGISVKLYICGLQNQAPFNCQ